LSKKTPWPESANDPYRPSDRRLSAKLMSTFAHIGVSRSQRGGSPTAVISLSKKVKIITYNILILPVIVCGCETWSQILKEEHRLRMFKNDVPREIFGPKGDEVTLS
jgi:hypothetical protein